MISSSKLNNLDKLIPNKQISVFIGTWNMNTQKPTVNLSDFISPKNVRSNADLIVIGTQETSICDMNEWKLIIQNILGPLYTFLSRKCLGSLQLILFARLEIAHFCSEIKTKTILTKKYKILKTKGAIALAITVFGTKFLFITTHLSPCEKNMNKRVIEMEKLINWTNSLHRSRLEKEGNVCIYLYSKIRLI